ncbi:hypothetical protein BN946_scf184671.g6 [Trametes cinnabarina]|uniref:SET domain-containing protein n=1 Tax=Pycnoporus cinnabarinus TaxID=5643 RepID=A0A060SQG1_PYCCI|nr:hypothetical protein BN946_scf184671.g6 [Trametes cinnabarina]
MSLPPQPSGPPNVPSIPSTPAPLHIRTDPHSGRKYHASAALPADTDLLGRCVPYTYTIWKRFRNEVCAECWRYDGGRRAFLTRRDDDGLDRPSESAISQDHQAQRSTGGAAVCAGLWFCDERCQREWIAREGAEVVDLLRQLEAARQKKPRAKRKLDAKALQPEDVTPEAIERAWEALREKERSPKEVRRWREVQLEDYEADMARYVLLALHRYHRERCSNLCPQPSSRADGQHAETETHPQSPAQSDAAKPSDYGRERMSEWETFAALQCNEVQLLKACPEILEHQTRIYQLLKACFGSRVAARSNAASSRSSLTSAPSPTGACLRGDNDPRPEDALLDGSSKAGSSTRVDADSSTQPKLADLVTVENVRTILGVDPGNSFGIWETPLMEESECLGFAVYPVASFFNHRKPRFSNETILPLLIEYVDADCAPNVRKERDGRTLRFLTTRPVEDGEELCISYGHVETMDVQTRRQELQEGWYFECRCSRCTAEAEEGSRT